MNNQSPWRFDEPPNEAAVSVRAIIERGEPILLVARDAEDGGWQFLTGGRFEQSDAVLVTLRSIVATDPTVAELRDLPFGWTASRSEVGGEWTRHAGAAA